MPVEARLDGQIAVVSGGGRGIGRASAVRLAEAGARVVVTARTASEIDETVDTIRAGGGTAHAFAADVSCWDQMCALAEETAETFGTPDVVVANAGVVEPVADAWRVDAESWASNLSINLVGAFFLVRAFLPPMVERGSGVLIFTSSGAATHPVPGWSAYCASKAGVDMLVRNLAADFEARNLSLRAHAFYPGVVDTSMQKRIREKPEESFTEVEKYRSYHRRGVLRPPQEPAALVWWLATPMAADYHGKPADVGDRALQRRVLEDLGLDSLS